jgi:tetratricopeptide (TPR) repeat protein
MDPAVSTSIAHTFFLAGKYKSALEIYGGRAVYYLDAAAWAALGDERRAIDLLRERLESMSLSKLITALMASLLAVLEGRTTEAVGLMQETDTTREPEILFYFARHCGRMGKIDLALKTLKKAAEMGFVCAPQTLISDAWLHSLHEHPKFDSLLKKSEHRVREAQRVMNLSR